MTDKNHSNIFNDNALAGRWEQLADRFPILKPWGLEVLRGGLAPHARTIVSESEYICKDHRNLHSNFYSKKFSQRPVTCSRLHFFAKDGITASDLLTDLDSLQDSYIGYSVLRPVSERCLGRTIIDPYLAGRHKDDGFYVLRTPFKTHLNGPRIAAHGFPYMSQDGEATVCAHSALWGVCRYLSERYSIYPELLPFDFVRRTSDTNGRAVPYRGMTYTDYSRILVNFGCHPVILPIRLGPESKDVNEANFRQLCVYVESGFPVLASYSGHVVSVVGHTMDKSRTPKPDADGIVESHEFLKQFVVVDDNFFPYQLLGMSADPENYGNQYREQQFSIESIATAVCPLPEKVFLPASNAIEFMRSIHGRLLKTPHLADALRNGTNEPLVVRYMVTTSSAFKRRKLEKGLVGNRILDPFAVEISSLHLPHFIWLMEIGPGSAYLRGECTGEIVLDATANRNEEGLLYARTGPFLQLNGEELAGSKIIPSARLFPQYTHNLGEL